VRASEREVERGRVIRDRVKKSERERERERERV
jgi:hypothetical protein